MRTDQCFFCGEDISGKVSQEHIFGDSFLGYLGLKQENVTSSQPRTTLYSKIKVPAHLACNNQTGSEFEAYVLSLVKSMDSNLEYLVEFDTPCDKPVNDPLREALSLWLAKLYFGLLYWEAGLRNHHDKNYQSWLVSLLDCDAFTYFRRCMREKLAFRLPSSLYYFCVPDPPEAAFNFDFADGLPHGLIFLRFNNHLLIAALGDGGLVREWFTDLQVQEMQKWIDFNAGKDPVAYLQAVSQIWAVRELMPVQPTLIFTESSILDKSRDGLDNRPKIDSTAVNERAKEIFEKQVSRWNRESA